MVGPGPGLEVIADKAILREGEKAQLHVFKSLPDGSRKEVTAASTGTRYLTFAGNAVADTSVVNISSTGLVLTTDSIGHFNYRTVVILVRNEDSVGWIVMTNRARKGWVSHHDIPEEGGPFRHNGRLGDASCSGADASFCFLG